MDIHEVIVDYASVNTPGGLSVFYFDCSALSIADNRTYLATMLGAIDAKMVTGMSWTIRTEGKILDDATGDLVGVWSDASAKTGVGLTSNGTAVANAAQVLLRWRTNLIVRNRMVQGRNFLPGLGNASMSGGQLIAQTVTDFNAAIATYVGTATQVIWSRPTLTSPGSAGAVQTGSVWAELAVLRKRRA